MIQMVRGLLRLIFLVTLIATPKIVGASCVDSFRTLIKSVFSSTKPGPVKHDFSEIHPDVQRWINEQQNQIEMHNFPLAPKTGSYVKLKDIECETIAKLGAGAEGNVYLVRTTDGLRTLKVFANEKEMRDNLRSLSAHRAIRSPKIITSDPQQSAALLEYMEGIPLAAIMKHGERAGYSLEQARAIREKWSDFLRKFPSVRHEVNSESNVVYSPGEDIFLMIDPH